MNNREFAKRLIDKIPESRLLYVISYLQGATVPDKTPNADDMEVFDQPENNFGHNINDPTEQLLDELLDI